MRNDILFKVGLANEINCAVDLPKWTLSKWFLSLFSQLNDFSYNVDQLKEESNKVGYQNSFLVKVELRVRSTLFDFFFFDKVHFVQVYLYEKTTFLFYFSIR